MFREFLIKQNKSRRYFADLLGVSQQAIQHWMSGRSLPSKNHISDLAALCNETELTVDSNSHKSTRKSVIGSNLFFELKRTAFDASRA